MTKQYPFGEINSALAGAKNIGILLPENPDYDLVAASLALSLSLEKVGKTVAVASPTPMTVEFSQLVGVDKITDKIKGGKNMVISIDYPLADIEKVSYNDDGGRLNLVIQPKDGLPPIPREKINFPLQNQPTELHFLIGNQDTKSLKKLNLVEEIQVQNSIAIDRKQTSSGLGKIKVIDSLASSYSEIVTAILVSLSLPSDQDIAQNLFLGLVRATDNFSSQSVGADTFEAAALCLRAGAKKDLGPKIGPDKGGKEEKRKSEAPAPDWLQPKIYRGTSLV